MEEKVGERIVEVPVEKIVEVPVERVVEKIVERIGEDGERCQRRALLVSGVFTVFLRFDPL